MTESAWCEIIPRMAYSISSSNFSALLEWTVQLDEVWNHLADQTNEPVSRVDISWFFDCSPTFPCQISASFASASASFAPSENSWDQKWATSHSMSESSGKANNRLALPKKGDGKGITQLICYFGDGFMAFKNSHELGHGTIAIDAFPRGLDIQKQAVSLRSAGPWGRLWSCSSDHCTGWWFGTFFIPFGWE